MLIINKLTPSWLAHSLWPLTSFTISFPMSVTLELTLPASWLWPHVTHVMLSLTISHINRHFILDSRSDHAQPHDRRLVLPSISLHLTKPLIPVWFLILTHIFTLSFFLNICHIQAITVTLTLILNLTLDMNFIHPLIHAWPLFLYFHTLTLNLTLKLTVLTTFFIIVLEYYHQEQLVEESILV